MATAAFDGHGRRGFFCFAYGALPCAPRILKRTGRATPFGQVGGAGKGALDAALTCGVSPRMHISMYISF